MRFFFTIILIISFNFIGIAQKSLDRVVHKFNKGSIPYIQADEVPLEHAILLDTREREEFNVSHLKNAIWVGYKNFQADSVRAKIVNRDSEIIVYCSIGVRSENIGEKLRKMGYTHIKNLYGGIFEWKNKGYPVFDNQGKETEKVHAFSKYWGKFLTKGEKVYPYKNQ